MQYFHFVTKFGFPSTQAKGPKIQGHITMNAYILRNAYAQQKWNETKLRIAWRRKLL
jgi:hypothetical protein